MAEATQDHTGEFAVGISMDIGTVTLDNAEIKKLYYIEDIFSYATVGKMIIQDNRGIFEFGPLTGNEIITLSYGDDNEIIRQFKIYKISNIDQVSSTTENMEVIEIFFADEMFFLMNFLEYSYSWKDTKISKIIKDLGENFLNVTEWGEFEDSNEELEYFYMPYWNVKTSIHWLLKRATGNKSKEPGYCFYNNSRGANLVTLEKLLQNKKLLQIFNEDDGLYRFQTANDASYNKILNWSISGIDMSSLPFLSGGVKRGYNSLEKRFINEKFEYKDSIKRQTILGEASLFPDISQSNVSHHTLGETDKTFIDNMFHNQWNKKYALQQAVSIMVRGHEDRYCGSQIEIFWPSGDQDDHYNKHMHGRYLIKSITHVFSGYKKPSYSQKLVCIKNGYGESDVKSLVKSAKRNN